MTESEWLTSEDPAGMVEYLEALNSAVGVGQSPYPVPHTSDRKFRLFACACRRLTDLPWDEASSGWQYMEDHPEERVRVDTNPLAEVPAIEHARLFLGERALGRQLNSRCLADLLREVVGSPLRTVREKQCDLEAMVVFGPHVFPKRWLTPIVTEMARNAHDSRDFGDLPILADALEEAGCNNEHVLRHLRGEELVPSPHMSRLGLWMPRRGPHVLGCWVLDLILGKS